MVAAAVVLELLAGAVKRESVNLKHNPLVENKVGSSHTGETNVMLKRDAHSSQSVCGKNLGTRVVSESNCEYLYS